MARMRNLSLLLPLFVVCSFKVVSMNECRSKLLQGCYCSKVYYDRKTQFVVNCTDTGFNNTDMLKSLPEQTQALIFTGNKISTLPWNIFGSLIDLNMLKTIDMSNNHIKEIKGKSYHHVLNVQRLILNHNDLTISNEGDENYHHPRVFSNFVNLEELHLTNAFADNTDSALADDLHDIFVNSNLTKLYKLHLEQNEIKSFKDENVFCDLPNLHDLYLGNNYIPSLNFNILCLKRLRFLDLEYNKITKFTQKDLDNFDRLAYPVRNESLTIEIQENPLKCDSALKTLYPWVLKTNVTVRHKNSLQCEQSKHGIKYALNLKLLNDSKHAKISKAITVLLVILVLALISLLSAYVYLSKEKFKVKLNPLIESVTRKVHYTTIDSQDV